jgi:hypothetical protein
VNRLFIEIDMDEDVDVLVGALLRARGFVAVTTQEAGNLGASDSQQPGYAVSEHKTILTHNRVDFEALDRSYRAAAWSHSGIIIAVRHPAHEIVRRLLLILNQVTADEMTDMLQYI